MVDPTFLLDEEATPARLAGASTPVASQDHFLAPAREEGDVESLFDLGYGVPMKKKVAERLARIKDLQGQAPHRHLHRKKKQ